MAKKKEKKAATEEGTVMGEALKKAGFKPADQADPETPAAAAPEILMTYEVVFSYEASSGKRYHQSSIVSECRNAMDAQQTVKDEIQKRGLDVDKIDFGEIIERPDLLKEVVVEAQIEPDGQAKMFPETPAKEEPEAPSMRQVTFNAKIVDVNVKQGDTRLLKIVMLVGSDIPRVNSELLEKFKSSEMLFITVEPFQLTDKDVKKHKADPVTQAQVSMAEAAPAADQEGEQSPVQDKEPEMIQYT